MYDRILLATDGTVSSRNTETHAIELAKDHVANLHGLFVVDESVYTATAETNTWTKRKDRNTDWRNSVKKR